MKYLSSAAFSKRNFAFGMSPLALLTLTACGGGGGGSELSDADIITDFTKRLRL